MSELNFKSHVAEAHVKVLLVILGLSFRLIRPDLSKGAVKRLVAFHQAYHGFTTRFHLLSTRGLTALFSGAS